MKFKVRDGNFIKSENSTNKMMYHVIIALLPIVIFSFYKNGILPVVKGYGNILSMFRPLVMVIIPMIVGVFVEYIYYYIRGDKKDFNYLINESFAMIPGLFIGLIISLNTPIWLVIIVSIIASLSKVLCGGFGKNIFNPALFGVLFITLFFKSFVGGYLNLYEIDTISAATPLANLSANGGILDYNSAVGTYGSLLNFFIGNIPGSLGETSSLLCILGFIYLCINKVIKFRIPLYYIAVVFIISLIVGLCNNLGIWYSLFHVLSGGLLFGAIFMATDPVTTPISKFGQILAGILLGILTMSFRLLTSYPEGVLLSILIINVLTIFINKLSIKINFNKLLKGIIIGFLMVLVIVFSLLVGNYLKNERVKQVDFIIDSKVVGNKTTYRARGRGYTGNNAITLDITFLGDKIVDISLVKSTETYIGLVNNANYLNIIVDNQDNLDDIDTVSGATYTSKYIKQLVGKVVEYHENN